MLAVGSLPVKNTNNNKSFDTVQSQIFDNNNRNDRYCTLNSNGGGD